MLKLRNLSHVELSEKIRKEHRQIIVYGAGVIGQIVVPQMMEQLQLCDYLQFFVDADIAKQGSCITVGSHIVRVSTREELQKFCQANQDTVILITNTRFYSVLEELDSMKALDGIETYIVPIMQLTAFQDRKGSAVKKESVAPLIPKIIHYCWFSGNEMPDYLKRCIESWEKCCPDYEIRRWDESNYDINKSLYMKQAYSHRRWGYIPDYARLDILYTHGGFYLDTDVELLKSLDELRYQPAFCGVEKWGIVNLGGCSGAVAKHPMIEKLLRERENILFEKQDGHLNLEASGTYETRVFIREGMRINNRIQIIEGMTVYSADYFHPYDYMSGETCVTENTFSIHHFDGGWLDEKEKEYRKKTVEQYRQIRKRMEGRAD